ncbi:N-acetylmuramoyl-L-alanine amidase [Deinococcus malanensis]|uniref:N-acetylmuramoyl-L-alanine amidase n=1 Tax=Deinococcus malanensis TaxID=1706855 RepID=UPI0036449933
MLLCTLLTGALLAPGAHAAPRVGSHDGFTRLVFDLPATSTSNVKVQGQSITVQLSVPLKADQGPLSASGVTAYAVAGKTVTVTLAKGHSQARASVLPASGAQKARLVIDVPTSAAASKVPATPRPQPAAGARTPAAVARPASTTPAPPAAQPAVRPRVVLDAGHGGRDPGAQSRWTSEEEVTLDIALRTRAELVKHGVDVVMARESDRHLSANKAQDLEARSRLAKNGTVSAFVSIHVNAAGPGAQGIETFYFGQPLAGRNRSLAVLENGGGTVGRS